MLLWVPAAHFYDDFYQIDLECLPLNSCDTTERLSELLGCEFKDAAYQLLPPAATFQPLGVCIDFPSPRTLVLGSTAKRKMRIQDEISRLLKIETMSPAA